MVISPTFDFSRAISSSRSSRSRSFRAVAAPESARSRHSVSLATETFVSRATSSNGSPRNNRATTANLRLTEKRFGPLPSTPEGAPALALGERSGAPSGLRPSSFVMSDTPVEAQSTSAGCLNYPCRTPEAIRINPKNAAAFYNRGLAYSGKGDSENAIQAYNEAIRLNPKYASAVLNRGILYATAKDYARAIQDFDEAIRLNPKNAAAFNSRGNAYRDKGDNIRVL